MGYSHCASHDQWLQKTSAGISWPIVLALFALRKGVEKKNIGLQLSSAQGLILSAKVLNWEPRHGQCENACKAGGFSSYQAATYATVTWSLLSCKRHNAWQPGSQHSLCMTHSFEGWHPPWKIRRNNWYLNLWIRSSKIGLTKQVKLEDQEIKQIRFTRLR